MRFITHHLYSKHAAILLIHFDFESKTNNDTLHLYLLKDEGDKHLMRHRIYEIESHT